MQIGALSESFGGFLPALGLSPSDVVWQDPDGTVHVHPRAGGAATTFAAPVHSHIAATDTAVTVAGPNGSSVVWDGSSLHTIAGTLGNAAGDGSQIYAFVEHHPSLSPGMYPVSSTGTLGARVLPIPTGGTARTSWVGEMRVAPSTIVAAAGHPGFQPAVSGDRTIAVVSTSTGRAVRELIGTTKGRTIAIGSSAVPALDVSGPRLVIGTGTGAAGARLVDLIHGTTTKVTGNASVWGPYLVWATSDGRIWRRDLTKPVSTTNPKEVWHVDSCTGCVQRTLVWGAWVGWSDGQAFGVKNVATGTTRSGLGQDPALTEGALVYFDGNRDLSVEQLSNGVSTDVSNLCGGPTSAADERLVVWVDACSGTVEVARVPFEVTLGPRLLYQPVKTTFTPNHDGKNDTWKPEWDVTKPLSSYTLRIRNSADHVVRTFKGAATYGAIRLVWNGKSSSGSLVKGGTYRWTLTGNALDGTGVIRSPAGPPTTVKGTVVVKR